MKKTLMVMCFALCTTLVFAQAKHSPVRFRVQKNQTVAAQADKNTPAKASYKGSIFNIKAAGDVLHTWDFAAPNSGYTTGVVGANQSIINQSGSTETMVAHAQTTAATQWNRIPDTTADTYHALASLTPGQGGYPALCYYFGDDNDPTIGDFKFLESATAFNGFMVMSMIDQYQAWGGSGSNGKMDSYIALEGISTVGAPAVFLECYQYFRKFNWDKSYIDYCTDGTTWKTMEINVRGIDCNSNDWLRGQYRFMLPNECGNQANLQLRIRWASDNNGLGTSIYGYMWFIDDVTVTEAANDELTLIQEHYCFGYHQMPKGMLMPITWYANLKNTGINDQAQITVGVNHLEAGMTNATSLGSYTTTGLTSNTDGEFTVDGMGTLTDGFGLASPTAANANIMMNTSTTGDHFLSAYYSSPNIPAKNLDTIIYQVNDLVASPDGLGQVAVWALDNGVLTPRSYYTDGFIENNGEWYGTDGYDDENPSYTKPGYAIWNRFVTGTNIPQGWVIRGMQLVAATMPGINVAPMSHITADLMMDVLETDTSTSLGLQGVSTGASIYETQESDFNYYTTDGGTFSHWTQAECDTKEYMLPGEYNVINIMFPQQPELLPRTSYRLGYELQDGYFATAGHSMRYVHHFDEDDDSTRYWMNFKYDSVNPVMKKYGATFNPNCGYSQFINDPDRTSLGWGFVSDFPPMIRMLVGPAAEYPEHNVQIQCEGESGAAYVGDSEDDQCGQTVSLIEGNNYIYFEAEPGYTVRQIFINGTEINCDTNDVDIDERVYHYTYNESDIFRVAIDVQADMTVKVVYGEAGRGAIDAAAAKVSMNLNPNPATNNVQLSIAGVNGTVNCAILDMSGRVVYNQNINAEATQNINLSNLAKGAYFVRITNSEFTKVEKLIVR